MTGNTVSYTVKAYVFGYISGRAGVYGRTQGRPGYALTSVLFVRYSAGREQTPDSQFDEGKFRSAGSYTRLSHPQNRKAGAHMNAVSRCFSAP